MFGAGGDIGGSVDGRQQHPHQQQHQAAALQAAAVANGTLPTHALASLQPDQAHISYYNQQHAGYQQWLPAQFAQFQLGAFSPHHAGAGGAFYAPAMQAAALPSHASPEAATQAFVQMGLTMGLPPDAAQPRGWGGMQIHDQLGPRLGGYAARGGRGAPRGGRGYGADAGRMQARGGRGRRGRTGPGGFSFGGGDLGPADVLLRIKRLPPDAPIDEGVLQMLRMLDSRSFAVLIKDLGKSGLPHRAQQLFDAVRRTVPGGELAPLLDEFTYTAMISNCVGQQDLARAMALVEEMVQRGIERNVHTFSALMNVCIKCGQYRLALDVYRDMQAAGCTPNVVTMNTLIDLYGKSGQWEEALAVLEQMKRERIAPVTRTFNTLMIACNTSNQWQEALRVYDEMVAGGHQPNTTTYNALISAHSKGGDLAKVLSIFKEMVQKGCERSVITYSSLISACEKAGEWKLALQLFEEMRGEGCVPNVISFNSLITACAQGAQWEKAAEVFEQMQRQGCRPDVVTYTALIQAYERGGQWRRALAAFEEMRARPCNPDAIVYNAIIDVLWDTGLGWAQRKAVDLFRQAMQEGLVRSQSHEVGDSAELNLHSTTAGVALLSLHCWLHDLSAKLHADGPEALPEKVCIIAGKGKSKDTGHSIIKESVTAMLRSMKAPFKESPDSTTFIGRLEAPGKQVAEWLLADGGTVLSMIIPAPKLPVGPEPGDEDAEPADQAADGALPGSVPEAAVAGELAASSQPMSAIDAATAAAAAAVAGLGKRSSKHDPELEAELATESRVAEAFKTVQFFEETHCLNLQVMPFGYLQKRSELIALARTVGAQLALPDEAVYDAVLLMDRAMSVPLKVADGLLGVAVAACLVTAAKQSGLPADHVPALADVAQVTGVLPELLGQMQANVLAALSNDTASISALRCLKLYLERLGADAQAVAEAAEEKGKGARSPFRLLQETLADGEFLNYRPSVVAAAVLAVDRRSRGLAPYWPSTLSQLTSYGAQNSPELTAAVAGAQRLYDKLQVPAALWNFQPSGTAAPQAAGSDLEAAGPASAPPTPVTAGPTAPGLAAGGASLSRDGSATAVPLLHSSSGPLRPAAVAAAVAQLLPGSGSPQAAGGLAAVVSPNAPASL